MPHPDQQQLAGSFSFFYHLENDSDADYILQKYNLNSLFYNSISVLQEPGNPLSSARSAASSLVLSLQTLFTKTQSEVDKLQLKLLVPDIIYSIFTGFIKKFPDQADEIITAIRYSSIATCEQMEDNFNVFKKLIDYHEFNTVLKQSGSSANTVTDQLVLKTSSRIVWTDKGRLEELVYQLLTRKLIKSKTAFFNLLLKEDIEGITVKWDFLRKTHLALLFYELYSKNYIRIISNKGYFSFVEKHFTGFDNRLLKKDSLKKISSAIHTKPHKYLNVIAEVTDIINGISSFNKNPLHDYCRTIASHPDES